MISLKGKTAIILGVASNRSIAYSIACALLEGGVEKMIFSVQAESLVSRVSRIVQNCHPVDMVVCDVSKDEDIRKLLSRSKELLGKVDILVHSLAYAPAHELSGDFVSNVTREGFAQAHDISAFSLAGLARHGKELDIFSTHSSIIAMTYIGSSRYVHNYNTMGIAKASLEATMRYIAGSLGPFGVRVNCISAGPIKTPASMGIKGFRDILKYDREVNMLKKNIATSDVGHLAAFLASDAASSITAEVIHVDAGMHAISIPDRMSI